MISSRPYLLRAFYEWIVDNDCTPYIVVSADHPEVIVPKDYVENGRIVLNIAPEAVRSLILENAHVEFNARFAGVPFDLYIPMKSITAIYAKENGRGMVFKEDEDEDEPPPAQKAAPTAKAPGKGKKGGDKPKLTIVK